MASSDGGWKGGARADGGGDHIEGEEEEEDEYEGEGDFMAGAKAALEKIKAARKANRVERPRASETRYLIDESPLSSSLPPSLSSNMYLPIRLRESRR